MPVPARSICPKCKGETDIPRENCLACAYQNHCKILNGSKHVPSHYLDGKENDATNRRDTNGAD